MTGIRQSTYQINSNEGREPFSHRLFFRVSIINSATRHHVIISKTADNLLSIACKTLIIELINQFANAYAKPARSVTSYVHLFPEAKVFNSTQHVDISFWPHGNDVQLIYKVVEFDHFIDERWMPW